MSAVKPGKPVKLATTKEPIMRLRTNPSKALALLVLLSCSLPSTAAAQATGATSAYVLAGREYRPTTDWFAGPRVGFPQIRWLSYGSSSAYGHAQIRLCSPGFCRNYRGNVALSKPQRLCGRTRFTLMQIWWGSQTARYMLSPYCVILAYQGI